MKRIVALMFGFLIFLVISPPGNARGAQPVDKALIVDLPVIMIHQAPALTISTLDIESTPCMNDPVFNLIRTDYPSEAEAPDTPTVRKYLSDPGTVSYKEPISVIDTESRFNCSSRFD